MLLLYYVIKTYKMWDVSRLEVEKMFPDSCRYKSSEGKISVNMGMMACSLLMKFTFVTSCCN